MKAALRLDDSLYIVAALTKKRLEKKLIKVIKEHIFDPYGVTYPYFLIRRATIVRAIVTLVEPFDDSGIVELYKC